MLQHLIDLSNDVCLRKAQGWAALISVWNQNQNTQNLLVLLWMIHWCVCCYVHIEITFALGRCFFPKKHVLLGIEPMALPLLTPFIHSFIHSIFILFYLHIIWYFIKVNWYHLIWPLYFKTFLFKKNIYLLFMLPVSLIIYFHNFWKCNQ